MSKYQIVTFYEFRKIAEDDLADLRERLRSAMRDHSIRGTFIIAKEGFNATVAGARTHIPNFVTAVESLLQTKLEYKSSFHEVIPFRRVDVKIKPEIVTLNRQVVIAAGAKTHVSPAEWNKILADSETFILDARNDYEYRTGTFRGAVNPGTNKFSDLPDWVAENLDPKSHKRIAMFCTGGIRCEKFAPYMKSLGFEEIFQLKGGILKYLEDMQPNESLWEGECFVFDDRVTVDHKLTKGRSVDLSQQKS